MNGQISKKKKKKRGNRKKTCVVPGQTFLSFGRSGMVLTKRRKIFEKNDDDVRELEINPEVNITNETIEKEIKYDITIINEIKINEEEETRY